MTKRKRKTTGDWPGAGTLDRTAREDAWLDRARRGEGSAEMARKEGLDRRTIQRALASARLREQESRNRDSHGWDDDQGRLVPGNGNGVGRGAAARPSPPEPRLVPLFPIGPLTPLSVCPHRGPIRPGSMFCCMVCSRSGMDGHPALRRDPRDDPRPEPKATPAAAAAAGPARPTETRKQRRRRLFAAGSSQCSTKGR